MVIRLDVVVEQVVDSKTYFKFLVLEEFSANEQIAEVELIVISSLSIFEILEYEGSSECVPLKEHPLEFCRCVVHDEVVGHLAEFAAIVIQCVSGKILDSEV